jgi:hypothetical protein
MQPARTAQIRRGSASRMVYVVRAEIFALPNSYLLGPYVSRGLFQTDTV